MNIEQARAISIVKIFEILQRQPVKQNGYKLLYSSILRKEKTPSLWVNAKDNTWHDFGDVKWVGGDIIHLVRAYLDSENENCEVSDALRWMSNMAGFIPMIKPVIDPDELPSQKTLVLRRTEPLTKKELVMYGENRGIPEIILKRYFQQAILFNNNTKKMFHALCMQNDKKGYELRNPYFKGCIGKKYITFIRGTLPKPDGINIFEGAFDFATAITQQEGMPFEEDSLILHSLSNLRSGAAYLKNYGYRYVNTWMDNDQAGQAATLSWQQFCETEPELTHIPQNGLYYPYKDVNAAHVAILEFVGE